MRAFFVALCLLLAAGTAISPEDIAAARQACTHQCQDNDKIVMAKCMRACWKNFFDGHQHTAATTTAAKKRHTPAPVKKAVAPKSPVQHKTPKAAPKAAAHSKAKVAGKKHHPIRVPADVKKPLGHSYGYRAMVNGRSLDKLLVRAAASQAGVLVLLLAAGAFLMA